MATETLDRTTNGITELDLRDGKALFREVELSE